MSRTVLVKLGVGDRGAWGRSPQRGPRRPASTNQPCCARSTLARGWAAIRIHRRHANAEADHPGRGRVSRPARPVARGDALARNEVLAARSPVLEKNRELSPQAADAAKTVVVYAQLTATTCIVDIGPRAAAAGLDEEWGLDKETRGERSRKSILLAAFVAGNGSSRRSRTRRTEDDTYSGWRLQDRDVQSAQGARENLQQPVHRAPWSSWRPRASPPAREGRPQPGGQDGAAGGSWAETARVGAGMEKVTGIGGIFFRSSDPVALGRWYEAHLGVSSTPRISRRSHGARKPAPPSGSPSPRRPSTSATCRGSGWSASASSSWMRWPPRGCGRPASR